MESFPAKYDSWIRYKRCRYSKHETRWRFFHHASNQWQYKFVSYQFRIVLPCYITRQIHLKDEEDWEVGLHLVIYPFSWFEVPHECDHPTRHVSSIWKSKHRHVDLTSWTLSYGFRCYRRTASVHEQSPTSLVLQHCYR